MCLACQQGLEQPVALPIAATIFTAAELDSFHRASAWENDDSADLFSDLS
jgi:hypothetical protein